MTYFHTFYERPCCFFSTKEKYCFFATYLVYHSPGLKDSKTKQVEKFLLGKPLQIFSFHLRLIFASLSNFFFKFAIIKKTEKSLLSFEAPHKNSVTIGFLKIFTHKKSPFILGLFP